MKKVAVDHWCTGASLNPVFSDVTLAAQKLATIVEVFAAWKSVGAPNPASLPLPLLLELVLKPLMGTPLGRSIDVNIVQPPRCTVK